MTKRKEAYKILCQKGYLETKDLLQLGIESIYRIKLLVKEGTLKQLSKGKYVPASIKGLFSYGEENIRNRNFKEAFRALDLCYELDPASEEANLYKMYRCIAAGKHKMVLDYLEVLLNSEDYKYDANLYLVLLHYSIKLPEKYKERLATIRIEDTISDSNENYKPLINRIKKAIFDGRLSYANELFNHLIKIRDISLSLWILSILLHKALTTKMKIYRNFSDALSDFDWFHAINILKRLEKCYGLNYREKMFKGLLEDVLEMETTQIPIMPTPPKREILDEWILHRNYKTILATNGPDLTEPFQFGHKSDIIQVVSYAENLRQNLITKNERLAQARPSTSDKPPIEMRRRTYDFTRNVPAVDSQNDTITQMYIELTRGNKEVAFVYLEEFMNTNMIALFTDLIKDLINLCMVYEESSFMDPMMTIGKILEGEYVFDIDSYLAKLKDCLDRREVEASKIYLNIINNALNCGLSERSASDVQNMIASFTQNSDVLPQNFILKPVTSKTEE